MKTFILPGLDGTDLLLADFIETAPEPCAPTALALPDRRDMGYEELAIHFDERITSVDECTLIGESFSGPLAILLAQRHPHIVKHLVLVATFATSPIPRFAARIPWSLAFRLPLPAIFARRYLTGKNPALVTKLQAAVRIHDARTLARRVRETVRVDVRAALSELTCQITYIRATADAVVREKLANEIDECNARVVVHPIDGPHLILQTAPELSWRAICGTA